MSFLETPRFPECQRYGYTVRSQWNTTITQFASGDEDRNRNWERSLRMYNVQMGPKHQDVIEEAADFWESLAGEECGFRFHDHKDYKSCALSASPAATDQVLLLIAGSPGGYQLTKTYRKGTRATVRKILKPVEGTIRIADNGVAKNEGSDWILDYTSGLLTAFFSPVGQVTWGGEFDVPVRFDGEFPIEVISYQVQQVQFQLVELKNPRNED
jgi:uncharacterized protein (TIGR02217 family)